MKRKRIVFDKYEDLIWIGLCIFISLGLFTAIVWGAARGSGSTTNRCIGSPCENLYLPVSREEPGYFTDASSSVNRNMAIISSAVYNLQFTPNSTNYIQLIGSLQSNATFYVSCGTIDQSFYVSGTSVGAASPIFRVGVSSNLVVMGNGNVGISTTSPLGLFTVGGGTFVALSNGNVGIATGAPQALFSVGGGTLTARLDGRVGISSASPVNTLSVTGGGHFSSSVTASAFIGDGAGLTNLPSGGFSTLGVSSSTLRAGVRVAVSTYDFIVQNDGNVGVNTSTPTAKLDVRGGDITIDGGYDINLATSAKIFASPGGSSATFIVNGIDAFSLFPSGSFKGKLVGAGARTGTHGMASDTNSTLPWGTELFDTDNFHAVATSQTFTVPAGLEGVYLVAVTMAWEENNSGDHEIMLVGGGGGTNLASAMVDGNAGLISADFSTTLIWIGSAAAADDFQVLARHLTGGVSKTAKSARTSFLLLRLGP